MCPFSLLSNSDNLQSFIHPSSWEAAVSKAAPKGPETAAVNYRKELLLRRGIQFSPLWLSYLFKTGSFKCRYNNVGIHKGLNTRL